jgi:hypothetical protein
VETYAPIKGPAKVLPDRRLLDRLDSLIDSFAQQPTFSIPLVTDNRNDMDAAYNFFKNPRVSPPAIAASCLPYTLLNLKGCARVLALQDSSELNFSTLAETADLGCIDGPGGSGLKFHSCLAVTAEGVPAGLLTQQIWVRDPQQKGKTKQRRQRDAEDKESYRWRDHANAARQTVPEDVTVIQVADREGDIYQWFAAARPPKTHLLVRVAQAHRIVVHGPDGAEGHLREVAHAAAVLGQYPLTIRRKDGEPEREATLTVRAAAMHLQPPRHAKQRSQLKPVPVWVIEAVEESPPEGLKAVCWRLVTTEEVTTWEGALRALREYVLRWLIERYHYTLKSGCGVEQLQLTTAARLSNALAVYSQVAVRLLRLTYLARVSPQAAAGVEFTPEELEVLGGYQQQQSGVKGSGALRTLGEAVRVLARLGGHQGRAGDGPPGVKVLWRGIQRLHDLVRGYRIAVLRSQTYP